jgi:hypothetical protein
MPSEGYLQLLGKQMIVWSGWVFTVGGAIASLWIGNEFRWIGGLFLLTGILAVTGHSYAVYREVQTVRGERDRLVEELRVAERKLNEVPLTMLAELQAFIAAQSLGEMAARLIDHADYVFRMRQFEAGLNRRIELRSFVRQGGLFFAVAKVPPQALALLHREDRFILVRDVDGLKTDAALLEVNQRPDSNGETLHLRVIRELSEEITHLEALAVASGSVK